MNRSDMVNRIGAQYLTANIEEDEYSYAKEAGSKSRLEELVGHSVRHYKLDRRFEDEDFVVLIETKQSFVDSDADQLRDYLENERALHRGRKIICILANTNDDKIRVWKSEINDNHLLSDETVLDSMEHYKKLFAASRQNDREKVMRNTYALNELLHRMDINEALRSQFVGTSLLYIKDRIKNVCHGGYITDENVQKLIDHWSTLTPSTIRAGIAATLESLLDGSANKAKKIELLQKNVLNNQKVKSLKLDEWTTILKTIVTDIYKYIDVDSSEGQDILNLFFITFNKYTGKADKNQAFTPDHITEFMARITAIDKNSVVLDPCCGSGSFLVQAMVKELADCRRGHTEAETRQLIENVKKKNIFGVEVEEVAYGLSTTNMLIHGDGNSNIEFGSCFEKKDFIKSANPTVFLMNPPYNAKPKSIPDKYKANWTAKQRNGKEDPSKGMVFVKYLSDIVKELGKTDVKLAVLLPVQCAIGTGVVLSKLKEELLEDNTLEAVFTLPNEVFYPGASASVCCMLFTLGTPHNSSVKTFFGYCKEDGFKKRKNLGRIEQFDKDGNSVWKSIENEWINLYRNKETKAGFSAVQSVTAKSEWLCEAYMKTDYADLQSSTFESTLNYYLSYLMYEGKLNYDLNYKHSQVPSLNTNDWKEFNLFPHLFNVKPGIYYYPEDYVDGETPYVSAANTHNGISKRIDIDSDFCGNTITIGKIGATAFYQCENFCATSDVNILIPNFSMSKYIGLFITNVINFSENYKWCYGRQCRVGDTKEIVIKLPVLRNEDGTPKIDHSCKYSPNGYVPDWEFMEKYIKQLPYGDRI